MRGEALAWIELSSFKEEGDTVYFQFEDGFGRKREGFAVLWEGELRAFENRCPHWKTPLNTHGDGVLAKGEAMLICHTHGALFRMEDGYCVSGPCMGDRLEGLEVRRQGENRAGVYRRGLSLGV